MRAEALVGHLKKLGSKQRAVGSARFFKTYKGGYAEGDQFLGIIVPTTRAIAKEYETLSFAEISKLIKNPFHEIRLAGLVILVAQAKKATTLAEKKKIFDFYMKHVKYVNNWDFVDATAEYVVGPYLSELSHTERLAFISKMIASKSMWENRIIMISTFYEIKKGNAKMALYVAERLLGHKHDLMHKAVGWMLREVGKRASKKELVAFLDKHVGTMPRTALRYAIEHFSPSERKRYMDMKRVV
jgi:3-methyladenine DNA glycosylase AlkD